MENCLYYYEWLVMPFGMCNAPATFQTWTASLFERFNASVDVFQDDLLVFTEQETTDSHMDMVRAVCKVASENKLRFNTKKVVVCVPEVEFLG